MNLVAVSGRISRNIKASPNNKTGNGAICIERPYPFSKDQNGNKAVDFLTIKFIGEKNVINAAQYLTKGTAVKVFGHICKDQWKNANGEFEEYNYILVTSWEFELGKSSGQGEEQVSQTNTQPQPAPQQNAPEDINKYIPESIDADLPFI